MDASFPIHALSGEKLFAERPAKIAQLGESAAVQKKGAKPIGLSTDASRRSMVA